MLDMGTEFHENLLTAKDYLFHNQDLLQEYLY